MDKPALEAVQSLSPASLIRCLLEDGGSWVGLNGPLHRQQELCQAALMQTCARQAAWEEQAVQGIVQAQSSDRPVPSNGRPCTARGPWKPRPGLGLNPPILVILALIF